MCVCKALAVWVYRGWSPPQRVYPLLEVVINLGAQGTTGVTNIFRTAVVAGGVRRVPSRTRIIPSTAIGSS